VRGRLWARVRVQVKVRARVRVRVIVRLRVRFGLSGIRIEFLGLGFEPESSRQRYRVGFRGREALYYEG
jgi:hypothetical protein